MHLKSDKNRMYVKPLYLYPSVSFVMFFLVPMFFSEKEFSYENAKYTLILFAIITASVLLVHYLLMVPIGRCDIVIDRNGVSSEKIKKYGFEGFVKWDCIQKVKVFDNPKGPNIIDLYIHPEAVVDNSILDGSATERFDLKIITIRFDFVPEPVKEIEKYISKFKKIV